MSIPRVFALSLSAHDCPDMLRSRQSHEFYAMTGALVSAFLPSSVHVLNDVPVPMRDGVRLSADVYLPDAVPGPWPVLLARTPYDNNLLMDLGFFWAQHGYVYVAQDVRGRYDSEGQFVPWDHETDDGYDTLEWIGAQTWCAGNVGMTGGSYLGQVQW